MLILLGGFLFFKNSLLLSPLKVSLSCLLFHCCDKSLRPRQFIEGRVYFGRLVLDPEGESVTITVGKPGAKRHTLEAETAVSLHLELQETQRWNCKWRGSFETSETTPWAYFL